MEAFEMRMFFTLLVMALICVFCVSSPAPASNEDFLKVYAPLITEWSSALNELKSKGYTESGTLSFDFYDRDQPDSAKAYYALYDIDANGTPELILRKENKYEDIIAYIFSIKDGKPINIFGDEIYGAPREVPWSRDGASAILSNGLIDSMADDGSIYRISEDGCGVTEVASRKPNNYPDEAGSAKAEWRYYINGAQVEYDFYVRYLSELGYVLYGDNALAKIDWVEIR